MRFILLRGLPRAWHGQPCIREFAIPALQSARTRGANVEFRSAIRRSVHEPIVVPPTHTASVTWAVAVTSVDVGTFSVRIFGIRYRTRHAAGAVDSGDVFDSAATSSPSSPMVGSSTPMGVGGNRAQSNPYAALYGLLYPPPDELGPILLPKFGDLRPYQREGVEFLVNRDSALLADDMGLGKTAQCAVAMAVLLRSERIRRALIICPRSVVRQWEQEAHHWAGLFIHPVGGNRHQRKSMWRDFPGVVIATPKIVLNDIEAIANGHFDLVVCDDISMLKNPGQITTAIRRIPRERSWCLSGTPLENKPEDLTNVMEFVRPGLFSAQERLRAPTRDAIQSRIRPYLKRRRKLDCLKDLPNKQCFKPVPLEMEGRQAAAYRAAEAHQWAELQQLGVKLTRIHVFALMNVLLRLCNFHEQSGESAKEEEIGEQLDILFESGDPGVKAVVFSHWVETLEFLQVRWARHSPLIYRGALSPSAREAVLDEFRQSGRLLLISTKAGGRGLNLQEASYVYHFDRTWNPIDELQAEDRCWRMGQQRNVFVYRYTQVGTIEERIHQVLAGKHDQFTQYVDTMTDDLDSIADPHWSTEELIDLMRPPS